MELFVMGRVRARKETGKLYLDFMYAGHRCREQTALPDTSPNRKKVEKLLQKVEATILLGAFNYAEFFPDSRNLRKFEPESSDLGGKEPDQSSTPMFIDFADQWLEESRVQWRKSHTRNVAPSVSLDVQLAILPKFISDWAV
jgi:integrase